MSGRAEAGVARIAHMASLARSGETLVLRTLAAHPAVHVVHDLYAGNTPKETRLFQLLRVWPLEELPRAAAEVSAELLLVKQGVFAHRAPYRGFGLVRNPYAVFCSLWNYDARLAGQRPTPAVNLQHWHERRLPRLAAWVDASLPELLPRLLAERDPIEQFLLYWQARTEQIVEQCDTLVTYEDFTRDPEAELRRICAALALPWEPAMLRAHLRFRPGQRGHGGIDLGEPIRPVPAWSLDDGVPLEPFARAVEQGPVVAWRDLYRVAEAA